MPNKKDPNNANTAVKTKETNSNLDLDLGSAQVSAVMSAIGRLGGQSRSKRKLASSRKNAAKATAARLRAAKERRRLEKLQEKNGKVG